jgi:DNA segregation ATPase FtsK/SpoIIIE-like protein
MSDLSEQAQHALTELQNKIVLTGCTSYVQRKLQCGYNRACNILEELERAGWISEPDGTGTRLWRRSPQLTAHTGENGE